MQYKSVMSQQGTTCKAWWSDGALWSNNRPRFFAHTAIYTFKHGVLVQFQRTCHTLMPRAYGKTRYQLYFVSKVEATSTRSQHPGRRSPATLRRMLANTCISRQCVNIASEKDTECLRYHLDSSHTNSSLIYFMLCVVVCHSAIDFLVRRVST